MFSIYKEQNVLLHHSLLVSTAVHITMFAPKLFLAAVLFVGGNCRYVVREVMEGPHFYIDDSGYILQDDLEDALSEQAFESVHAGHLQHRARRQAQGSFTLNNDMTSSGNVKVPIAGNDKNMLSAIGGVGLNDQFRLNSATAGLALDNVNGHGLTLTKTHIPDFGSQLTAAGKLNLMHNNNHDLNANAFVTRNMPSMALAPNFNTVGGGLDYMYKNKVGASLGASHTDFIKRTDLSAMGNLNLMRTPTSSLDFKAGVTKSMSPYMPRSSWQPNAGFSFTKYFGG